MRSTNRVVAVFALLVFGFGAGFAVSAFRFLSPDRMNAVDALIVVLALLAGWARIKVEPSAYATLTPLVLFIALLLGHPLSGVAGVFISSLFGARFIGRRPWLDAIEECGEELAAIFGLVAAIQPFNRGAELQITKFLTGVAAYLLIKTLLAMVRGYLFEGVSPTAFLASAGKYQVFHVLLLTSLGLGIYFLYGRVGYLIIPLSVIAAVEFYYPAKLISEQREISFASLAVIAEAIDAKDPYTATHSRHVMETATRIARVLRLPESEVRKVQIGALLHDIGKIGVSGRIIRKPGALDNAEQLAMREHPVVSANIMQPVELLADAAEIVRHHHEHIDGSGYPDGLKGGKIPMGSRIILVADAFDAMTTDRPYRKGRSKQEALGVLKEHAGRQFDRGVVDALESIINVI